MISRWTSHLKDQEEIEKFKKSLQSSRWLLDRLKAIIEEEELGLNTSELSNKQYDNPNWPNLQAHKNGYRQALSVFKKLTNLDQKDNK